MYKITATIIKPGNPDVTWTRYSSKRLTLEQCEELFYEPRKSGKPSGNNTKLKQFQCVKVEV
ncbi:DUF1187 family protein [Enterobacter asburiae]|uniref:DUF1187 family protein n=1 Tax=Enterobacter asburiae TaxID=61645 RepID=UPI002FF8BDB8